MQKLQHHLKGMIDISSNTYSGYSAQFRAIPSPFIKVLCESSLDSLQPGSTLKDLDGVLFVVIAAQTVANHMLLELLPVPDSY